MQTKIVLIIVDLALAAFAISSAYVTKVNSAGVMLQDIFIKLDSRVFPFMLLVCFSSFLMELYNHEKFINFKVHLIRMSLSMILAFFMISSFYYFVPYFRFKRYVLIGSIGIFSMMQVVWHTGYHVIAGDPRLAQRVLVLGTGPLAQKIGVILTSKISNYSLLGFVSMPNKPANGTYIQRSATIISKGNN